MMNDVFVVSAVRTPVGKRKGYLRNWTAPLLLGAVLEEAVRRIDLDPALVDYKGLTRHRPTAVQYLSQFDDSSPTTLGTAPE